jgi:hypothetical protein
MLHAGSRFSFSPFPREKPPLLFESKNARKVSFRQEKEKKATLFQ